MNDKIARWADEIVPWLFSHGIKIVVIAIGAFVLNKFICKFIEKAVRIAVKPDAHSSAEAERKRENTLIQIFSTTFRITILIIALMMILQEVGLMIGPVLAAAGIVGLAVGFGGQYLIRDIIAGLFIILENQYRIGDAVILDNTKGTVEEISLRMTTLRDLDGTVHHIPNGEIKRVSNQAKNFARVNLNVGIAYDTDIEKVIEVVNRIGKQLSEDEEWRDLIISPPQFLRIESLADSAIIIKILGDTQPLSQAEVTGELRKRILIAFKKEGIEIPFPQQVIHEAKIP